jgi:hypothetical protein
MAIIQVLTLPLALPYAPVWGQKIITWACQVYSNLQVQRAAIEARYMNCSPKLEPSSTLRNNRLVLNTKSVKREVNALIDLVIEGRPGRSLMPHRH